MHFNFVFPAGSGALPVASQPASHPDAGSPVQAQGQGLRPAQPVADPEPETALLETLQHHVPVRIHYYTCLEVFHQLLMFGSIVLLSFVNRSGRKTHI